MRPQSSLQRATAKEALATSAAQGTSDPILYRVPDTLEAFAGYEISF